MPITQSEKTTILDALSTATNAVNALVVDPPPPPPPPPPNSVWSSSPAAYVWITAENHFRKFGEWLALGYVSTTQMVAIANSVTGERSTVQLGTVTQKDDHNQPCFAARADGVILATYSEHNGSVIRARWSQAANDPRVWGSEFVIPHSSGTVTYPWPVSIDGELHVFCRRIVTGKNEILRMRSGDNGASWDVLPRKVIYRAPSAQHYPYVKSVRSGGRLHHFITPGSPHDATPNALIYHAYFEAGSWYRSDGSLISSDSSSATIALTDATMSLVRNGGADYLWVIDAGMVGGQAACLYQRNVGGSVANFELWSAIWNGTQWSHALVANLGPGISPTRSPYYSSCAAFDAGDVIASVKSGQFFEVQRFTLTSGAWLKTEDLTSASSENHIRPIVCDGASPADAGRLAWMSGTGEYIFDAYSTRIAASPEFS